jgi:hypothetical protein
MRFPLLAITAISAALATSNANATDDTVMICHFASHEYRMDGPVAPIDNKSGETDMYRDGSYLGPWHYVMDLKDKVVSLGSPDKSTVIGFVVPASMRRDQLPNGIPMGTSLFIVRSTKQETPGDCTLYAKT